MNQLDLYLDRMETLPPSPTVALQLLDLFSDPDRDIDRIVELIQYDPSLTAATLKRCNSGALSGAEPASDMFEAVTRLGLYEVYTMVVGLLASRTMTQVRAKYSWDASQLWRHSVTAAVAASVLGRRVEVVEAAAFTAGLLHDLGKLICLSVEGTAYAELLRNTRASASRLIEAETAMLGFTHAALGARLLARWDVPENICVAVELHHQTPAAAASHQRLAATVNFANCLAHQMLDDPGTSPAAAARSPEAMTLVELSAEEIPAVIEEINQAAKRVKGLMQMST